MAFGVVNPVAADYSDSAIEAAEEESSVPAGYIGARVTNGAVVSWVESSNFDTIINGLVANDVCELFGAMTAAGNATLNVSGVHVLAGAPGDGRPLTVVTVSTGAGLTLSGGTPDCNNVTIEGLTITGAGDYGILTENYVTNLLIDSCTCDVSAGTGIQMVDSKNTFYGDPRHDYVSIVDCVLTGRATKHGFFGHSDHLVMTNTIFDGGGLGHSCRISYAEDATITGCTFRNAGSGKHELKFHGPTEDQVGALAGLHTQNVDIVDCIFQAGNLSDWTASIGPQSASYDERLSGINIRTCTFTAGTNTDYDLRYSASNSTIQGNTWSAKGYLIAQLGIEPAPVNVTVIP
jgi:hypothetical protein